MSRWKAAKSALGVTVAAAATVGSALPAKADNESMTANICGNVCPSTGAGAGNLVNLNGLKNLIGFFNLSPLSLGINEACGAWNDGANQAGNLKNYLYDRNNLYVGRSRAQTVTGDYCNSSGNTTFGIAQYVLSSDSSPTWTTGSFTQFAPDENRGFLCINGGVNTPKYWGCTAHMKNDNPGASVTGAPAEVQFADYYRVAIKPKAAAKPVYWGGDLYVFANEIPNIPISGGNFSYAVNQEADLCYNGTYVWTHRSKGAHTKSKYDYTFRSGPNRQPCTADAGYYPWIPPDPESVMYDNDDVDDYQHGRPLSGYTSDHRIVLGSQPCC